MIERSEVLTIAGDRDLRVDMIEKDYVLAARPRNTVGECLGVWWAQSSSWESLMSKTYLPYEPDQQLLLPAALQKWLPDDHLAYFISDVVDQLDM